MHETYKSDVRAIVMVFEVDGNFLGFPEILEHAIEFFRGRDPGERCGLEGLGRNRGRVFEHVRGILNACDFKAIGMQPRMVLSKLPINNM